ncbi:MAG: hypothetical protein QNK37_05320 [Acidobacteriota bacterium]|nr:hypothetical protein [Acidobacteriota bacterium]
MELFHLIHALWIHKFKIAAATLLPALAFGMFTYLGPRTWSLDLLYHLPLEAVSYKKLSDRFYSPENITRIADALKRDGHTGLAEELLTAEGKAGLQPMIRLNILPGYIDFENKERLKISLERSWADNITKLEKLRSELLSVHLRGAGSESLTALSGQVRHNFSQELPLYLIHDQLRSNRLTLNARLGQIEGNRFEARQELLLNERIRNNLENISKDGTRGMDAMTVNFEDLKFEDPQQTLAFLPLPAQKSLLDAMIVRRRAAVEADEAEHAYRTAMLALTDELIEAVAAKMTPGYTLDAYRADLDKRIAALDSEEATDFLKTHIRYVENLALGYRAMTNQDKPIPLPRGTIGKTLFAAVVMLILSVLVVSIAEYLRRAQPEKTSKLT